MKLLTDLIRKLKRYESNIPKILKSEIIENEAIILDMNTEDQLYEQGITSAGKKISDYAPYHPMTIAIKKEKGQPTNRVTLRDTGDFEASFYITYTSDGFQIKAADWKAERLIQGYGDEIIGLTDENLQDLIFSYLYPKLIKELRDELKKDKK